MSISSRPILIQCDFDGTVTVGDVSFLILDHYTGESWRRMLDDYMAGKISVNRFNAAVFSKVKAGRHELDEFVKKNAVMRPGFKELVETARRMDIRFVIVSNGMMFYIETLLKMLGLDGVEFTAAKANFKPDEIEAWYEGPDGKTVEDGFKEAWTQHFLDQGYDIIYIGNGASDFPPAKRCSRIFGIESLEKACLEEGVACTAFDDLREIAAELEKLA
ncbi:MAG: MtnX-like HAD-IB family phosphatase [Dehalococcoidia bacterium]|nr:MtnX-like HAD-IB family phosphatase [Dehalococcoidia bacterium]